MGFDASSVFQTLFTAVIAGLSGYLASYAKTKGAFHAATEDLKKTLQQMRETTRVVEVEKARVATEGLLAADQRKTIYALATAIQSLIHSMCWLAWDKPGGL